MSKSPDVTFTVAATVPEVVLREMYEDLSGNGWSGTWGEYLEMEAEAFREYASGWWVNDLIVYAALASARVESSP